jgi:hypothetical protein
MPGQLAEGGVAMSYPKQKFFEAVNCLIGSHGLQERLTYAAAHLVTLQKPDLPENMQDDFEAVVHALTREPLSSGTAYTPRDISDAEARTLAEKILSIYTKLLGGL